MSKYMITDGRLYLRRDVSGNFVPVKSQSLGDVWEQRSKAQNVLSEVRGQIVGWNPPTEEHKGIKKFALEQIDMCINPISMFEYYQKIIDEPFDDSNEAVQKYMEESISYLEQDVARAKEALEREIENAKGKTVFMKEFIDSLYNI